MKKTVGYINLYRDNLFQNFCHWTGSLYSTKQEANERKDLQQIEVFKKEYYIGEVIVEE